MHKLTILLSFLLLAQAQTKSSTSPDKSVLPNLTVPMGFFTKRVTVEEAVATFVRAIPRCVQLVREETSGRCPKPDATIVNISAGMFLFFLAGLLPYSRRGEHSKNGASLSGDVVVCAARARRCRRCP